MKRSNQANPDDGKRRRLESLFALSLAVLLGLVGYGIVRDHEQTMATAHENALNLAESLQVHATELLQQSASSLRGIAVDLPPGAASVDDALPVLQRISRTDTVSEAMGVAFEGEMALVDGKGGSILDAEWTEAMEKVLIAAAPTSDIAFLPLIKSPKGDVWYLPLVLGVPRDHGAPALAFALIPASRLLSAAASLHLLHDSFVAFFRMDGAQLFRFLEHTGTYQVGPIAPGPAMKAWNRAHTAGTVEGRSEADGRNSILGFSPSTGVPLVVIAGIPTRDLTLAWAKRSAIDSGLLLGGLAAITILGFRIRKAAGEHLQKQEFLATHDSLTNLPNRYGFNRHLAERIAAGPDRPFAVVLLDLNRFKEVNDTFGHHAGDRVLEIVGERLAEGFGHREGMVARLGGDELALCLDHNAWERGIAGLCDELQAVISAMMEIEGVKMELTASIGVSVYPNDADSPTNLMRCADIAMYSAKNEMRGFQRYSELLDHFTSDALAMKAEFASAIRKGELELVFQPKVRLSDGVLVGVEALSRWNHPTRGPIPPSTFVPFAETTELIHTFTDLVLRGALRQVAEWMKEGHRIPVAVNLSVNNLLDANFVEHLEQLLADYGVPASLLELEVTESALMRNPDAMLRRLQRIADLGVTLAIDDFGTGHSSMAYLKRLPVAILKIDRSFVGSLTTDKADQRIVRAAIHLGHEFGMQVVAEGVESEDTGRVLEGLDCDVVQGYHYGRPASADEITRNWLEATVAG
jgi:diguanylate cyclase (GGDEF)-like protein